MNTSKPILLTIALACLSLLGVALYLQHGLDMKPCPLCVMQRYAFAVIALLCLAGAALPRAAGRIGAGLGLLAALTGAGIAGWHLWVRAHPEVSCGVDPLETALNQIPSAELLPFLFKANGFCSADYAPILGLSIPMWALVWFAIFSIALARLAFKR
ncbi:disulfide bond formation protein B [Herminiimonas sp. CN]|uniref:disulfide bond formation protein B n=1 Tax=Herminiimonas sp. CN TaxID=1349818 RepID=UPI000472FF2B|nr:disulfide bond formation protein B [Herminiimonas sp. CN]